MASIVIDLDGTLTLKSGVANYEDCAPNLEVIAKLRAYRSAGFTIKIVTARNMRTHSGNVGLINVQTLPSILAWLQKHDVPYDEVHVGKPWCEAGGFYVDDNAIRPDEFVSLDYADVMRMLSASEGELR